MSLPRQVPSHSSSPSKSSLRQASNPPTRSLLPSPHFEEHTTQHDDGYESAVAANGSTSTHPAPAPPDFAAFFALVEDTATHEHFHPTVHYIFADDDSDIITEAACRSLEQDGGSQAIVSGGESRYLSRPVAGVKEHYVVLDVRPSPTQQAEGNAALEVTHTQSLSSEWQVLRTNITNAPTIGDSANDEGLMLRIEGRGNTPPDAPVPGGKEKESMEEMIERFQKRLDDIRQVMQVSQQAKTEEV